MALVTITSQAAQEFDELPLPIRARVQAIMERLELWPAVSGAKPLRGALAGHHRIRTGDYRVQFHARGDRIIIERVGHRGFYEDG